MQAATFLNPESMHDPSRIYTHVVVAPVGRMVFLAGQWGADGEGMLVSEDFAAQVEASYRNVLTALAAAGAGPEHVTKLTHYVVGLDQERRAAMHQTVGTIFQAPKPASTLLGVERLARDGMLYEVDAVAVLPEPAPPG
jgi:enamine deaminase RidA (YjgF/YER057c/UK114 family)